MARGWVVGDGPRRGCPSVCAAGARMPRRLGEGRRGCRGWGREGGSGLLSHTVSSSESGGRASARPLGLAVIVSGCSCFFGIQHYIPPQQPKDAPIPFYVSLMLNCGRLVVSFALQVYLRVCACGLSVAERSLCTVTQYFVSLMFKQAVVSCSSSAGGIVGAAQGPF